MQARNRKTHTRIVLVLAAVMSLAALALSPSPCFADPTVSYGSTSSGYTPVGSQGDASPLECLDEFEGPVIVCFNDSEGHGRIAPSDGDSDSTPTSPEAGAAAGSREVPLSAAGIRIEQWLFGLLGIE